MFGSKNNGSSCWQACYSFERVIIHSNNNGKKKSMCSTGILHDFFRQNTELGIEISSITATAREGRFYLIK